MAKNFQQHHLDVHDQFLRNPFHLAFASGNIKVVKFFMEKLTGSPHIMLFQRDCYNQTPFHLALKFYRTKFLAEFCAHLREKLEQTTTPLGIVSNNSIASAANTLITATTTTLHHDKKKRKEMSSGSTKSTNSKRSKVDVVSVTTSDSEDESAGSLLLQDE